MAGTVQVNEEKYLDKVINVVMVGVKLEVTLILTQLLWKLNYSITNNIITVVLNLTRL